MVKTEEKTLIIILPHPRPLEALADLQMGIIEALKYQLIHFDSLTLNRQQLIDGNYLLLELLQATLQTEQQQNDTEQ